jgi:Tfp pilus assembly protein PilF
MEQVVPAGAVKLEWEEDPILEAVELVAAGATFAAEELLGDLLTADLRCLDAHSHLAYVHLRAGWYDAVERSARHYRVGLAIGELTLGPDFRGLLPWGFIDNRPYLRCLNGYGLCLWRQGDLAAAADVFRRIVWLNPSDNTGARFNLAAVEAGRSWEEANAFQERVLRPQ